VSERKLGIALTLGIVLEAIEILRRAPRWLLLLSGLLLYSLLYLTVSHPWVSAALLAVGLAVRAARRRIGGPQR
jgi:uncharacterized membrane protein HdeD (DUF308 family)